MAEMKIQGSWVAEISEEAAECARRLHRIANVLNLLELDPALLSNQTLFRQFQRLKQDLAETEQHFQELEGRLTAVVQQWRYEESRLELLRSGEKPFQTLQEVIKPKDK